MALKTIRWFYYVGLLLFSLWHDMIVKVISILHKPSYIPELFTDQNSCNFDLLLLTISTKNPRQKIERQENRQTYISLPQLISIKEFERKSFLKKLQIFMALIWAIQKIYSIYSQCSIDKETLKNKKKTEKIQKTYLTKIIMNI